jgi:hypothetical protein
MRTIKQYNKIKSIPKGYLTTLNEILNGDGIRTFYLPLNINNPLEGEFIYIDLDNPLDNNKLVELLKNQYIYL